ncbi:MAG: Zn-ribbon domain-containing OB-fold protein [Dehalococcoidia bacterium]|nr:Zn-ribbon domain-containing OB-fold protein [Dehalococcoidia bacterium]
MPEYNKPIPFPDPFVAKPYWDGAKERRLMLPRCTTCSRVHFYPRIICPHCGRRTIEWIEASGEGYLYSFAVQHRAAGGWAEEAPFVTAYIDLAEGDRIFTVLRGVDANQPLEIMKKIGGKCRIEWDEANEAVNVPYWRLVE